MRCLPLLLLGCLALAAEAPVEEKFVLSDGRELVGRLDKDGKTIVMKLAKITLPPGVTITSHQPVGEDSQAAAAPAPAKRSEADRARDRVKLLTAELDRMQVDLAARVGAASKDADLSPFPPTTNVNEYAAEAERKRQEAERKRVEADYKRQREAAASRASSIAQLKQEIEAKKRALAQAQSEVKAEDSKVALAQLDAAAAAAVRANATAGAARPPGDAAQDASLQDLRQRFFAINLKREQALADLEDIDGQLAAYAQNYSRQVLAALDTTAVNTTTTPLVGESAGMTTMRVQQVMRYNELMSQVRTRQGAPEDTGTSGSNSWVYLHGRLFEMAGLHQQAKHQEVPPALQPPLTGPRRRTVLVPGAGGADGQATSGQPTSGQPTQPER